MSKAAEEPQRSRRQFLARIGGAFAGAAIWLGMPLDADASLPHLTLSDPTAAALHYTDDARKVDPAKNPTHKAGEMCSNCRLYQGSGTAAYGPCQLYPGRLVSSKGWCMGYQKKG